MYLAAIYFSRFFQTIFIGVFRLEWKRDLSIIRSATSQFSALFGEVDPTEESYRTND